MKINILFQNIEFANADQSKKEILKNFLEDLRNKDKKIGKQSWEIVIMKSELTDKELRILKHEKYISNYWFVNENSELILDNLRKSICKLFLQKFEYKVVPAYIKSCQSSQQGQ